MNILVQALLGPTAIVLVLGAVITWDRLREPHRNPAQPFAVVDRRTYRDGQRRLTKLLSAEQVASTAYAECLMESMRQWLRYELHTGRRSRRAWCASQLEQLELLRERVTGFARI